MKDIDAVVADYVSERREGMRNFVIQTSEGTMAIPVSRILYFEGSRKKQIVHLSGGQSPVVITLSMKQLEEIFRERGFLRIHSGFLVYARYIRRLGTSQAELTNGEVLPVSRHKSAQIRLEYMEFLKKEGERIY